MGIRRLALPAIVAANAAFAASAFAIPTSYVQTFIDADGDSYDALITAELEIWAAPFLPCCFPDLVPSLQYELVAGVGNDFTVGIPTAVTRNRETWVAEIPLPGPTATDLYPIAGLNRILYTPYPLPTNVAQLDDWCNPFGAGFPTTTVGLVKRGTCSFAEKVEALEDANASAALIVNDAPGQGAQLFSLGAFTPMIPGCMLSFEHGQNILDIQGTLDPPTFLAYTRFSARFDPIADPVAVPEPSTLALFGFALTGLALSRRKRAS